MAKSLKLSRDQLFRIFGNHEIVKQFEKLIAYIDDVTNNGQASDAEQVLAGNIESSANSALAQALTAINEAYIANAVSNNQISSLVGALDKLSSSVDSLAMAPAQQHNTAKADVEFLGLKSMAFQNTGATGTFTTVDSKVVTVVNGVITTIV
ncbi:hypothetical protein UFOVP581_24 [uncultured Caudovirales phage]|uniref:Uncharacterized protein n=1 Tax=uncultured Caudovirales phage TaxID=2100421 RepID=A0A6J5PBX0_9CAUD|nr:hypothetical protein UFOVP581_24 [uncultured Caudovirales phage]